MEMEAFRSSRAVVVLVGVLALFGLYLTSFYSYLLFHSLAEAFSIVVACGIFIILWNARRFVDNSYFLLLGIAYLFVGALDLIHTMAYPGMSIIQGSDTNLAAQLWIAARYVQSISLLLAPLLLTRKLRSGFLLLGYTMVTGLLLGAILYWRVFPACFVEGVGLTPFKIISEYTICLILLASLAVLYQKRKEFDANVLQLLMASIIVAIASELAFTQYAHAYAMANLIGHLLKIVSFYLIYKAVVETGLVKPYDLLFRNLKREEEAVRESEALLSDLYEHAPNTYFSVGRDGLILRCNDRAGELLGYRKEELLGKPVFELYADTQQGKEKASQVFQRFLAGEGITDQELQMQKADGTPVWISLTVNAVCDAQGQIVVSRSMVVDITERKKAQEALQTATKRYEMATQAAKVGVWDWNMQTGEFYLDANVKALLGYSDEEIPNDIDVWVTYVHPDDRQPVMEAAQAHIEGGTPEYIYEHRMLHKDGTVRWILSRGTAIRDAQGNATRMMGTDIDITDRKRLAEELEELDLIVSQSPAVAFLWRAAEGWPVEFVSENIRRFGYTPEDFLTEQVLFVDIVHPEDLERVAAEVARHSQDGGEEFTQEYRIITKTGDVRWVEDRTWIRRDEQDVITHYQGIVLDVTERTRAEEALDKEKERLRILVNESPLGVSIIGKDGHYEYVNPKFTEIFGYTLEDIPTGREWFASAYPNEEYRNQAISTWIADVEQSERGEAKPRTFAVTCKDGSEKEIDFRPVTMEAGDQFIIYEDITERKRAEERLGVLTRDLQSVLNSAGDGIIGLDIEGLQTFVNPTAAAMLGWDPAHLIGKESHRVWHHSRPDGTPYPEEECPIYQAYADGVIHNGEDLLWRKDGSSFAAEYASTPIFEDGELVGAVVAFRDITDRKWAEEQLLEAKEDAEKARRQEQERRQEAERRRQIAESLADIMNVLNSNQTLDEVLDYITSQAGRLLDNQAAGIYRLQEDGKLTIEATQGLLLAYAGGREIPVGQEVLRRATETRRPVAAPDLARGASSDGELAPDGQTKATRPWADLYRGLLAVPIIVADEVYGGLALYYSEPRQFPREEIELAAAFADQIGLAIENARLRDQVREAATVAERERLARDLHDAVTQTLFSAGLIAEALPRVWERSPERAREGLEELRQLTRGALAEMRTLLLELRPAALTEKPLGELLGHLTQAMTSRTRVSVTLTVKGDSSLSPEVQIALYRIAQEALNNVTKHASAAEASVDLHCQPGRVALSIQDDGRGFDPADALPDQLGLSIMRERAESIGATLGIRSQPDHGTRVTVDWRESDRRQSSE